MEALKDDREPVAQAAAQALVTIGGPAVDPLTGFVMQKKWDGSPWNLRTQAVRLACQALGQIGDPSAIETLMIAAKDQNSIISTAAERALQKVPKE
ncbi:MAG: HEAT repeat domain-containing protein [Ignavibacteriaceae bacterium]|nr:HEAT repeat domain-containing protein [Ignavibacteriaceae bacterium]